MFAPAIATVLLVPFVRPVFLGFLDLPPDRWAEGMTQVTLRAGIGVVGWLAVDVYSAIVRGQDREILAVLPVDPGQVVRYEVLRVAVTRGWLLPAGAVLLAPVAAAGAPALWAVGVAVLLGAWLMGLAVSAAVHLLAIDVAESPRWAPLLDLIRGQNPRPQAAFLYAPGIVLTLCGLVVGWGATAGPTILAGDPVGLVPLVLPIPLAAAAWAQLDGLARSSWFRGSAVLAEIDARYAALADRREALRVYLDWTVRWLPPRVAVRALKDLRHGWRARRTPVTGAWLVGLGAFVAGWTAAPEGVGRAAIVSVFGVWLVSAVGVLLAGDEPEFLEAWLPPGGAAAAFARIWVLLLWVQPCIWLGASAVLLRRGVADAAVVVGVGMLAGGLAVGVALLCGRLRHRGLVVYAPVATVAAAAFAAALGGLS